MPDKIFISYRRADTRQFAGRLRDALCKKFGKDKVFMDISSIEAGEKFDEVIRDGLRECGVFLALIGKEWLALLNERNKDTQPDYVRREIHTALVLGIPIIPVLEDGAVVPPRDELPHEIQELTDRNALEISETRFDYDFEKLSLAIQKRLAQTWVKRFVPLILLLSLLIGTPLAWYFGYQSSNVKLAFEFMNSGHYVEADKTFQQIQGLNTQTRAYHKGRQLIDLYHSVNSQKTPDVVEKEIQHFLEQYPKEARAYVLWGDLCVNSTPQKALTRYEKAVELDPNLPEAWFSMGYVYAEQLKDPLKAVSAYKKAAEMDPGSIRYQTNLADMCAKIGDYAKAALQYKQLINSHEKSLLSYIGYIKCLRLLNRMAEARGVAGLLAVQLRDDAIFLTPSNAEPWYLERQDQKSIVIDNADEKHLERQDQKSIVIDNADEKRFYAHYQMALTHFLAGSRSEASEHVRQAHALNLKNSQFLLDLLGERIRRLGEKQADLTRRLKRFQREFL